MAAAVAARRHFFSMKMLNVIGESCFDVWLPLTDEHETRSNIVIIRMCREATTLLLGSGYN